MCRSKFVPCRLRRAEAATGVDLAMSKADDIQIQGQKIHGEGDTEYPGPGLEKTDELKQLAASALADVEELKRSEKAASAYASSAFNRQWDQP